VRGRMRLRR